jgi:hypothetical protein
VRRSRSYTESSTPAALAFNSRTLLFPPALVIPNADSGHPADRT